MLKITIIITTVLWTCFLVAHAEEKQTFTEGNDTYNFYFQKAPGPQTVNQGSSSAAATAPPAAPAPAIAPAAASTAPAPSAESESKIHTMEFSLGVTAPLLNGTQSYEGANKINQFVFGVQVNTSSLFAFSGEYFSANPVRREGIESHYWGGEPASARARWAAGGVITPLRSRWTNGVTFTLSGLGGFMQIMQAYNYGSGSNKNSAYYGARTGLQFGQSLALNLQARRVTGLDGLQGQLSLAYLF